MRIAAIESLTDSELGYSAIYTKPAGDVEPEECPFSNSPCPARLIIDFDENAVLFYLFVPAGNSSFEDPIPEPGELKTRKKNVQIAGGLISVRHVIFSRSVRAGGDPHSASFGFANTTTILVNGEMVDTGVKADILYTGLLPALKGGS